MTSTTCNRLSGTELPKWQSGEPQPLHFSKKGLSDICSQRRSITTFLQQPDNLIPGRIEQFTMHAPGTDFVPVKETQIGLDRANINTEGQIQIPSQLNQSKDHPESQSPNSSSHGLLNTLKGRKHDATAKLKQKLHISKGSGNSTSEEPILAETFEGESDARLMSSLPELEKNTFKDLAHNPVGTIKDKVSGEGSHQAAANIAAKEIPHGQEVDLVNADSAVQQAISETEKLLAIQHLDELLKQRQNMFARWTMDRHITKLRILPQEDYIKNPLSAFESKTPQGDIVVDWKGYFKHASLTIYSAVI
jgi:hypothetical protein